jgi:hypothetical protein
MRQGTDRLQELVTRLAVGAVVVVAVCLDGFGCGRAARADEMPRKRPRLHLHGRAAHGSTLAERATGTAADEHARPEPLPLGFIADITRMKERPLQVGGLAFGGEALSLRIDGELRVDALARVGLGGRVAFSVGQRELHFDLPAVTVVPRQENGVMVMELAVVFYARKF